MVRLEQPAHDTCAFEVAVREATLISRRRVTLPADICAAARLVPGSKVDISVNDAGEIIVRPIDNVIGAKCGAGESAEQTES